MSRKYEHMTREKFIGIFRDLLDSRQTVSDFCSNYGISNSDFYYWKKKFGLTRDDLSQEENTVPPYMSQIRIVTERPSQYAQRDAGLASEVMRSPKPNISIELPNGIRMNFNGDNVCDMAVSVLAKLQTSNVLP